MDLTANSYYLFLAGKNRKREARRNRLSVLISSRFRESNKTYGPVRIHKDLKAESVRCSRGYIALMMAELGLRSVHKRAFRITTDSDHKLPVADNILNRCFRPDALNEVYASDITYIPTHEGWLYLAVVMDLCSRRVIGWQIKDHMRTKLVSAALDMAIGARRPGKGVIHHSDRGSQYASGSYQNMLQEQGIICSMSRKGNCWDNAPVESFFATLKKELVYPRKQFITKDQAKEALFEYIEVWYNNKRRHSTLDYVSPAEYERKMVAEIKLAAAA